MVSLSMTSVYIGLDGQCYSVPSTKVWDERDIPMWAFFGSGVDTFQRLPGGILFLSTGELDPTLLHIPWEYFVL